MPAQPDDSEPILAFCRSAKQGSLVAIQQEAKEAGVGHITDEQIQRLILAPRAAEAPAFDLEVYKRHL